MPMPAGESIPEPTAALSPPYRLHRQRRWLSWAALLFGALIGLRLLAMPHQPAFAPASRPWVAQVTSLTYMGGDPATLEVRLTLNNDSKEAVRRVQAALALPPPLKDNLLRTANWDPLLEGSELDYWAPQTGRAVTFALQLKGVAREQALTLLEQVALRLNWSPAELDPQGTRLEQSLRFADLWPIR
ncbi:MAG: hypothetical protein ACYC5Y_09395 [Symbiobacteriia bacterium]